MLLSLLVLLISAISISLIFAKNLVSFIIISGITSMLSTLFYVISFAPDVAITEAAVGSAISTIFGIMAVCCCSYHEKTIDAKGHSFNIAIAIISILIFITLSYLFIKMQKYGNPSNVINSNIADYYIKNADKQFAIPNIVTAILGGYRGLDTLFETTVIFAAAMGVRSILSDKNNDSD